MELTVIKIPRIDVWHEEYTVYSSVSDFVHLAHRLSQPGKHTGNSSPPVAVLKRLSELRKLPFEEIQLLHETLKEAAFMYHPPDHQCENETASDLLFPSSLLTSWAQKRKMLKKLTKEYTDKMVSLMDCQEKCWRSRDKMKQYVEMVECARMSLEHYEDSKIEYQARKYAVKQLKKDVKLCQSVHSKNVNLYHTMLVEENDIRKEMKQIAKELEESITGRLEKCISRAWSKLCLASHPTRFRKVLDAKFISQSIYNITCKTYTFREPPSDISSPRFNEKIARPTNADSVYSNTDIGYDTYAGQYERHATSAFNTEKEENFLQLKKGDVVKIKLVSDDRSTGFGYKKNHIKFSGKKWGFFIMTELSFNNYS